MELKVVKQDDKTLELETSGETITLTNLLREALWEENSVSEAAQIKEHPYLAQPKIFVKVSRGSPQTALEKTTEHLVEQVKDFREAFKKSLKS